MKTYRNGRTSLVVGIAAALIMWGSGPFGEAGAATAKQSTAPPSTVSDLGEAYRLLDAGHVREAEARFSAIVALDPSNLSAREGLVWTHVKSGAREKAAARADERLALSPDVAWRKQWINVVMALPARRVAALAAAQALVRERPADAEVHVILGRVLSGQSDGFHDATEAYRAALRLAPRDVAIRIQLARVLVWSARYAEAIAEYRRVIAIALADDVQEELARALVTAGRYAEAVAEYREVVARRPQDRELRRALGRALSSANHSAEAIKIFDDLVAENPADAEALRERAFIARWDGDFETARRLLRQAAAIRPGDPQIQGELESVTSRAAALTAARRDLTVPLLCTLLGVTMLLGHKRRTLCVRTYLGVLLFTAALIGAGLGWFYLAPWQ